MKYLLYFIFSLLLCVQTEITFAATQSNYSQIAQKPILSNQKQSFIYKKLGKKIAGNRRHSILSIKFANKLREKLAPFTEMLLRFVAAASFTLTALSPILLLFNVSSFTTTWIVLVGLALLILSCTLIEIFYSPLLHC